MTKPAWIEALPKVRGQMRFDVPMAPKTWLRAGGLAAVWFQPADLDDLVDFITLKPAEIPVLPVGVGSNLLIRDGGFQGVALRLSGTLAKVEVEGDRLTVGAGATDRGLAVQALEAGLSGFEFYVGIPGTLGGAICMNAGAFGGETSDLVERVVALDQQGHFQELKPADLDFRYRHAKLPDGWIVTSVVMRGTPGHRDKIRARMARTKAERDVAQPLRVATGGSTFKNPPEKKAWQLIDAAGCRGLSLGRAQMSEKHCNFLINTGGASAADIEELGEVVRGRVQAQSGVRLDWEIRRFGIAKGKDDRGSVEAAA